jgi:hypothetical protein
MEQIQNRVQWMDFVMTVTNLREFRNSSFITTGCFVKSQITDCYHNNRRFLEHVTVQVVMVRLLRLNVTR